MDSGTVKDSTQGLMAALIKVLSHMTRMMDTARPSTITAQNMKDISAEDLSVDMVSFFTPMETNMRANSKMT